MNLATPFELPAEYEPALRSGLRFIACQYYERSPNDAVISGFYDVKVDEQFSQGTQKALFDTRWKTQRDCSVSFRHQGRSDILIGFIVDDLYYHNRVVLADYYKNPAIPSKIIVKGMYTPDRGLIPEAEVLQEIFCLRDILYCPASVFEVINKDGRQIDCFNTEEEAKEYIGEQVMQNNFQGVPIGIKYPHQGCKIVKGTNIRHRPEIEKMARDNLSHPNGWTASPEFQTKVFSKVQKAIAEKRRETSLQFVGGGVSSDLITESLKRLLKTMTPEQLKILQSEKTPDDIEMPTPSNNDRNSFAEEDDIPVVQKAVIPTEEELGALPMVQIQQRALERKLTTLNKNKEKLIAEIIASYPGGDPVKAVVQM